MNNPSFKIYASSAGSGKTYTLAKEYLKLALMHNRAFYFTHILAVTFTNKAAEEMKARILKYLHAFAYPEIVAIEDPKTSQDADNLLETIRLEINQANDSDLIIEELRQRAVRVFKAILHEYASFSVSTIDSFVQRIVSAFTEELSLPFNFEVSLDSDILLASAVEKLLQKANDEAHLQITQALQSYVIDKTDEGKAWNRLQNDLEDFGKNLLDDKNYASLEKLKVLDEEDFLTIEKQIKGFQQNLKHKIKEQAQIALEIIGDQGLDIMDFYQSRSGIGVFFQKVAEGDIFKETNSYVQKFLTEQLYYSKSAKKPIAELIDSIAPDLTERLEQIISFQDKNKDKFHLYEQILRNIKKMSLLHQLQAELADIQRETSQIHISEFNQKILNIVSSEPVPFVYERLGERYNHILIDEFQDTSVLQWHNFLPLIENSLANGFFNLAVGDAKQSIYRFRGGEMELIVKLHQQQITDLQNRMGMTDLTAERYENISDYLESERLATNYRSTQEVIEFNNLFFKKVAENHFYQGFADNLTDVFDEHFEQKLPQNPKTGGHVQIDLLPSQVSDPATEPTLERIEQIITEALSQGFIWKDIAILCRKNKDARQVANFLKDKGYSIVSSDSLSLAASEAVSLIVAMMDVVKTPDNRLAKTEALYLFHRVVLREIPDTLTNTLIRNAAESQDADSFYEYLVSKGFIISAFGVQQMSIYELSEKIIEAFNLFAQAHERDFLFRFLDIILEFSIKKSSHLTDFLEFWERKKYGLSIASPEGKNAITVTSIHKSKGLEYPVVIVPYCDWSFRPNTRSMVWANVPREMIVAEGYDELILEATSDKQLRVLETANVSLSSALEKTKLAGIYKDEIQKAFLEALNMLYVAFTRAEHRLYVVSRLRKRGYNESVGQMLLDFMDSPELPEAEPYTYIHAQGSKHEPKQRQIADNESIMISSIVSTDRSSKLRQRHSVDRMSNLEDLEKSIDWGNIVHAAFAKIKTLADVENAIFELTKEGHLKANEQERLRESIQKIMEIEDVKPLFEANLVIRNEREILLPNGDMLRPDRVVRLNNKIIILDYKTGAKAAYHQEQVQRYINIYKDMGYPQVEGMIVYLEDGAVVSLN
jgi:ATP-dependent helicase/nuclease subunit A